MVTSDAKDRPARRFFYGWVKLSLDASFPKVVVELHKQELWL